jgi:heme/copper-type cytochrome/quinol oxidase subunit 2
MGNVGCSADEGFGVWKIAVGLLILAVLLSAVWFGHGVATGIGVPYPDPMPDQAAYERYHWGISNALFLASGVAWLAVGVVSAACVWRWLRRGGRAEPG